MVTPGTVTLRGDGPSYIKGAETRQYERGRMAPRKGAKCDVCIEADAYLSICKYCLNKRPEVVDSPLLMYVNTYVTRARMGFNASATARVISRR